MFCDVIDFKNCCKKDEIIHFLYQIFHCDFVANKTLLADKIYIDPISNDKDDGKEKIFWHITTKENPKNKKREFDEKRSARIKWIKTIILNYAHSTIKVFYHYENKQKVVRMYLWAYEKDFIVIIQKLGKSSSHLVTSFYIDKHYNKEIYEKRYQNYISKKDGQLKDCEWF
jgi:uncharacterized protein YifN (PemK superfamily)